MSEDITKFRGPRLTWVEEIRAKDGRVIGYTTNLPGSIRAALTIS